MSALPRLFRRLYGKGPLHLIGHLVLIAITAWVLSIIFEKQFAPRPWNLALWLLGGAVLHDGVFLPAWGVVNTLVARILGAGDGRSPVDLATGRPADRLPTAPTKETAATAPAAYRDFAAGRVLPVSRDAQRRVPVVNHVRVPVLISAVLFLVFLPRILNRQPLNFTNALGHAPPDFFMRWVWVTVALVVGSALLFAARWVLAGRGDRPPTGTDPVREQEPRDAAAQRFGDAGSASSSS